MGKNATPSLRSNKRQWRYLGNRWILMSCGRARIALGLPSSHRQIADSRKHADFWESRHESILYTGHTGENNKCKSCGHNNFNMVVKMIFLKCAIAWKTAEHRVKLMKNIGAHCCMYCVCRVLSMSDSLSSILGHYYECALQNFLCYSQRTTTPTVFI